MKKIPEKYSLFSCFKKFSLFSCFSAETKTTENTTAPEPALYAEYFKYPARINLQLYRAFKIRYELGNLNEQMGFLTDQNTKTLDILEVIIRCLDRSEDTGLRITEDIKIDIKNYAETFRKERINRLIDEGVHNYMKS